jgi:hypothetical protein
MRRLHGSIHFHNFATYSQLVCRPDGCRVSGVETKPASESGIGSGNACFELRQLGFEAQELSPQFIDVTPVGSASHHRLLGCCVLNAHNAMRFDNKVVLPFSREELVVEIESLSRGTVAYLIRCVPTDKPRKFR